MMTSEASPLGSMDACHKWTPTSPRVPLCKHFLPVTWICESAEQLLSSNRLRHQTRKNNLETHFVPGSTAVPQPCHWKKNTTLDDHSASIKAKCAKGPRGGSQLDNSRANSAACFFLLSFFWMWGVLKAEIRGISQRMRKYQSPNCSPDAALCF